mgnify:CR=1 FL=1
MKKSIIRLLALILVCVMLLPTFAACKGPDNNDDDKDNDNNVTDNNNPDDTKDPVTPPADLVKIEMSASASQIKKGETVQVTARVTGAKNTKVTWSVSHPDVVSVDENGLVTMNGDITIDYQLDKLNFDWKTQQGSFEFIPGDIEIMVSQRPEVRIEYIGDPLYVPPSADPNYEPIDVKA